MTSPTSPQKQSTFLVKPKPTQPTIQQTTHHPIIEVKMFMNFPFPGSFHLYRTLRPYSQHLFPTGSTLRDELGTLYTEQDIVESMECQRAQCPCELFTVRVAGVSVVHYMSKEGHNHEDSVDFQRLEEFLREKGVFQGSKVADVKKELVATYGLEIFSGLTQQAVEKVLQKVMRSKRATFEITNQTSDDSSVQTIISSPLPHQQAFQLFSQPVVTQANPVVITSQVTNQHELYSQQITHHSPDIADVLQSSYLKLHSLNTNMQRIKSVYKGKNRYQTALLTKAVQNVYMSVEQLEEQIRAYSREEEQKHMEKVRVFKEISEGWGEQG
ncbi:hypothetical protein FGO68_gene13046 [Halteria grandinella]|uniref:Uncharacterized protein n=1 Tax=Halteria grandinella TaxID=5974 RepID=A0A8J8NKY6_HALGN|nr:hypothetical protein FGO68_gene13046 [Halteria grandinella]